MKVVFTHRNGRQQEMEERDASLLSRLKRGTYQTRDMVAESMPHVSGQQDVTQDLTPGTPPVETPKAEDEKTVSQDDTEARVSPAARDLAEKHNIDLATVTGTGKNGRVTLRDVEAMIPSQDA